MYGEHIIDLIEESDIELPTNSIEMIHHLIDYEIRKQKLKSAILGIIFGMSISLYIYLIK